MVQENNYLRRGNELSRFHSAYIIMFSPRSGSKINHCCLKTPTILQTTLFRYTEFNISQNRNEWFEVNLQINLVVCFGW